MATIDNLRAALDAASRAANQVGVRRTSIVISIETWSAPIGTLGATLSGTVTLAVTPNPIVRLKEEDGPSFFGGGVRADATGDVSARKYDIGPIAQAYNTATAGGYTPQQLMPMLSSPANNVFLTLTGDDFQAGGERFKVVSYDGSRPLGIRLVAQRTKQ